MKTNQQSDIIGDVQIKNTENLNNFRKWKKWKSISA